MLSLLFQCIWVGLNSSSQFVLIFALLVSQFSWQAKFKQQKIDVTFSQCMMLEVYFEKNEYL